MFWSFFCIFCEIVFLNWCCFVLIFFCRSGEVFFNFVFIGGGEIRLLGDVMLGYFFKMLFGLILIIRGILLM